MHVPAMTMPFAQTCIVFFSESMSHHVQVIYSLLFVTYIVDKSFVMLTFLKHNFVAIHVSRETKFCVLMQIANRIVSQN